MGLDELNKGAKTDVHILFYDSQLEILDALCARYGASRAAVLGKMLEDHGAEDLKNPPKPGYQKR